MLKVFSTIVLSSVLLMGCEQNAQANDLQEMDDFHYVAQMAQRDNVPIMIMFTAKWCEFCNQLKREVLNPMIRGGLYDGYAMYMRQVSLDMHSPIKFSETETIQKRQFGRMYKADITPTLIFVDSRGLPVADPIIGVADVQLFGGMIHRSLNQAYENMGNPMRLPAMPEQMRRPLPTP